jgi:hypothetical protein
LETVVPVAFDGVLGSVSNLAVTAFSTTAEVLDAVLGMGQQILSMGTVFVGQADREAGRFKIVAVREGERGCGLPEGIQVPLEETV